MADLNFAYSDTIISPGRELGLAGYGFRARHGFNNSGIHDDLLAQALCLKTADCSFLLLALDLCLISQADANWLKDQIAQKTGLAQENILLCLSHTHAGPVLQKDQLAAREQELVQAYLADLAGRLVTISSQVLAADSQLSFKAKLSSATFSARLGYNRRLQKADGSLEMLFTSWLAGDQLPKGPLDSDIPILLLERLPAGCRDSHLAAAGVDRLVLFNVPIHPVVMGPANRYVSADYPGVARRVIEKTLGAGTKAIFLLGACGNINPLIACQNNFAALDVIGGAIGYGVCAALAWQQELELTKLACKASQVPAGNSSETVQVQTVRLGQAALAAAGRENFFELGQKVRQNSPFLQTLFISNSNGGSGYIPTGKDRQAGLGYEVASAQAEGFTADLHERLLQALGQDLDLLARL